MGAAHLINERDAVGAAHFMEHKEMMGHNYKEHTRNTQVNLLTRAHQEGETRQGRTGAARNSKEHEEHTGELTYKSTSRRGNKTRTDRSSKEQQGTRTGFTDL